MKRKSRYNNDKRTLPLILIIGGAVLIISVILYVALSSPTTPAPQSNGITIPFPDIKRASLEEAKQAYDLQTAVFLDVRDAGSFAAGHVKGAINIPLADLETRLNEIPQDKWILPYCT
jgi:hypothetical protein